MNWAFLTRAVIASFVLFPVSMIRGYLPEVDPPREDQPKIVVVVGPVWAEPFYTDSGKWIADFEALQSYIVKRQEQLAREHEIHPRKLGMVIKAHREAHVNKVKEVVQAAADSGVLDVVFLAYSTPTDAAAADGSFFRLRRKMIAPPTPFRPPHPIPEVKLPKDAIPELAPPEIMLPLSQQPGQCSPD